jgi:3-oxoacyl-[acyl-carrier protein] reductase
VIRPDDARLDGRLAVVTGGAVGIGEAVAHALGAFGCELAVCDRDDGNLATTVVHLRAEGVTVHPTTLDVRDKPSVERFVAGLDRVDILVNNAGGGFHSDFQAVSDNGQDALIRENFTSVTNFVRACAPKMGEGGSIVNVTSIEAHRAGPGYAVYSAMKAAVASLTKSLALELGPRGIRVNCVAPDVIPTPGVQLGDEVATPLPWRGHPDDVAGAVVWLAGSLSSFVTGTTIHVDGGNLAAGGWHRQDDGTYHT